MLGAALLKPDTYEDVEHDRGATLQAALVVILVSISGAVAGALSGDTTLISGIVLGVIGGRCVVGPVGCGMLDSGHHDLEYPEHQRRLGRACQGHRICPNPRTPECPDTDTLRRLGNRGGNIRMALCCHAHGSAGQPGLHLHVAGILRGSHCVHSSSDCNRNSPLDFESIWPRSRRGRNFGANVASHLRHLRHITGATGNYRLAPPRLRRHWPRYKRQRLSQSSSRPSSRPMRIRFRAKAR